jgi:signal peptidase I
MFCAGSYRISTCSMDGVLKEGDCVLVNRIPGASNPGRNRIVLFKSPLPKDMPSPPLFLSRCVGMPGDTVRITPGGYRISERFVAGRTPEERTFRIRTNIREPLLNVLRELRIPRRDVAEDSLSLIVRLTAGEERMIRENLPQVVTLERLEDERDGHFAFVIPPDAFCMLSDNEEEAVDSRHLGLIPRRSIVGNVWFCWYSKDRERLFKRLR